jgi:hypothetical protein
MAAMFVASGHGLIEVNTPKYRAASRYRMYVIIGESLLAPNSDA